MRVVIWGLAALLAGCGEKAAVKPKAAAPKAPRITQFYATETAVPKGGSVTLCYGTEDVETLTLRPSEGGELRPALTRCVSEPVNVALVSPPGPFAVNVNVVSPFTGSDTQRVSAGRSSPPSDGRSVSVSTSSVP